MSERHVAVVTGGRQGIGRGIALELARSGWNLVIIDRQRDAVAEDTLGELQALGAQSVFLEADIADVDRCAEIADQAHAAFGAVHTLVNNAGVQARPHEYVDVLETTAESFDRVMGINLRGTFFLSQAFARRMANQEVAADAVRSIVTVSSINAEQARTTTPEYCISKTGLSMLNKILAMRLARHGIFCYEVVPGLIDTAMTAQRKAVLTPIVQQGLTPITRWGQPQDIGRTVAALASGAFPFCTGEAIHIDGGMHIPRSPLEPQYMKQMMRSPLESAT